ncbi:aldo/keto reductase [Kribbella sp. GL6]|uniref:aldo/keto reductase n=1 Tax=Kribbella sp. GL6 TaxID=3419765 RepID=UPI003D05DF71
MAVPSRLVAPRITVRFRPPRFGLGGSHLGEPDEQTALATVDAAYQAGIRFFDTSPAYGEAERRVGTALQPRPRGEFLVSTRVVGEDPEESIRKSSEALGLGIDLVFLQPDPQAAFAVLARLRQEGVVRAVGVVGGEWEELERVVREVELDCVLLTGQYSLLDQQAGPLLDTCLARGVSVIVAGALVLEPETVQARRISAVCERYGVSLPQAALAYPSRHPAVTSVLITAASPAEIRADAALVRRPVPERLWKDPELIRLLSSD